jgi:glycosyltransferase involved in cell wall biosynthesis
MKSTISFIIPTIGRDSLKRTLESIEEWKGDEVIVVEDIPPSKKWGNPQRNEGMEKATGDYLAFIDDDDYYVPGHRLMMAQAIEENPEKPIIFKMMYPDGATLWDTKEIVPGNIGTPMILVPNEKKMLHYWEDGRNMADFIFVDKWKFPEVAWVDKVIALIGHNYG